MKGNRKENLERRLEQKQKKKINRPRRRESSKK